MSRFNAPIETNFSFVDTAEPANPEEGDTWYDPDTDEAAVWDGNSWHQMNVTQHGSLSGITSSDHHAKTTSAADLTDVSADSVADAHHGKTTSAADLTDVSADSVADAHHTPTTPGVLTEDANSPWSFNSVTGQNDITFSQNYSHIMVFMTMSDDGGTGTIQLQPGTVNSTWEYLMDDATTGSNNVIPIGDHGGGEPRAGHFTVTADRDGFGAYTYKGPSGLTSNGTLGSMAAHAVTEDADGKPLDNLTFLFDTTTSATIHVYGKVVDA